MRTVRHEFDESVRKLEQLGRRNPRAFKLRVVLLGLAGYLYIAFVLGLVASLSLLFPAALLFLTLPLAILVLRCCWVKVVPPPGIMITRAQAPRLFETLDRLRAELRSPRFHVVQISEEFNASASQVPRLGVFGWYKNYLTLGLPYLMTFSPQQFKAVLAHEMAHIFGADGRMGGWIYRVEAAWANLNQNIEQAGWIAGWLFRRFFRWYSPFFSAHAFVLTRANEYAADQFAARVTSPREAADQLAWGEIRGAQLGTDFWPDVWKRANSEAEPVASPFTDMRELLKQPVPADKAQTLLQRALNRLTNTADTHPALSDRLKALCESPGIPGPPAQTAAEYFLQDSFAPWLEKLDQDWRQNVAEGWKQRHQQVEEGRKKLSELEAKIQSTDKPEVEDLWHQAWHTEDIAGPEVALPLYRRCIEASPEHAHALFAVGRILTAEWDDAGVDYLERAAKLDSEYIFPATDSLYYYFMVKGQHARAQDYYERAIRQNERIQFAQAERADATSKDKYLPHALKPQELEKLVEHLARYPQIAVVYLVRKHVQYFPEKPMFVLGFVWRFLNNVNSAAFIQQLANEVPNTAGYTLFMDITPVSSMRSALRKVSDSRIYRRKMFPRLRALLARDG